MCGRDVDVLGAYYEMRKVDSLRRQHFGPFWGISAPECVVRMRAAAIITPYQGSLVLLAA